MLRASIGQARLPPQAPPPRGDTASPAPKGDAAHLVLQGDRGQISGMKTLAVIAMTMFNGTPMRRKSVNR